PRDPAKRDAGNRCLRCAWRGGAVLERRAWPGSSPRARSVSCERVHEGGGAGVPLLAGTTNWFGWKVHIGSFYPTFSLAFFSALAVTILGTAIIWRIGQRRPPGTPLTWG